MAAVLLAVTGAVSALIWFGFASRTSNRDSSPELDTASDSDQLSATICAQAACILVQAGGFNFLFGAGSGAAEGLTRIGAPLVRLDALFLTGTGFDAIAGLAEVRQATWTAGRAAHLRLVGPEGAGRVAAGVNAMMEVHDAQSAVLSDALSFAAAPLAAETVRTVSRRVVFDSGLLRITAYDGGGSTARLLYRIDYRGRVLLVAGCGIAPEIWTRAKGEAFAVAVAAYATDRKKGGECPLLPDLADAWAAAGIGRAYAWTHSDTSSVPDRDRMLRGIRISHARSGMRLALDG